MANKGSQLSTNGFLGNNDWLLSADGRYAVVLRDDGDLALCHAAHGGPDLSQRYWSALGASRPPHGRQFAIIQGDGNLVLYAGDSPAHQGAPYWASNSVHPV